MAFMGTELFAGLTVGQAIGLGGTALSAIGQIQSGKEQSKWNQYNAAVARRDAEASQRTANYNAIQKRKEGEGLLAKQRALYAGAGVEMSGSPLEVMAGTIVENEMDALMIEWEGKERSNRYREEATLSTLQGKSAKRAGYWGAGSSLLTGAYNTYRAGKG